jgi:two-component system CheB/CheR fusion protein
MSAEQLDSEGVTDRESQSTPTENVTPLAANSEFHVVGIGASAGSLDSLERLFAQLPTDTGMAFVVLQHLSPDFKSLMDELLSRRTALRIRQADHDMAVEPNTVYLLPPMKEMIIRQRRLLLNDRDPRLGLTLPIDLFFRSLAQNLGPRAVAVILSGSGSNGSRGVQEISRMGGTVICARPRVRPSRRSGRFSPNMRPRSQSKSMVNRCSSSATPPVCNKFRRIS